MKFIDDMLVDIMSMEGERCRCRLLRDTRVLYGDGSEGVCVAGTMLEVSVDMVERMGQTPIFASVGSEAAN